MLKFIPYILKNLLGHRVRSFMTIIGTALLMLLFLFVFSIQSGLHQLLQSQDDRLIVFQSYRFCPSSSQLPIFYEEVIRGIPGVKDVLPVKVVVNNCRASLDTVVFHGVPAKSLSRVRPHVRFLSGDWAAFGSRTDAALVGRRIAERRGIKTGQSFTIAGVNVTVAGIFTSEVAGEENVIYTHIELLNNNQHHQDLHATLYEVSLTDPLQAEKVASAIDAKIKDRFEITTETKPQKAHFQNVLADLMDLIGMTRWLGFVCIGVVVVLVANSVIMAAQDRVKEHAVLQTIGFSSWRIVLLMLTESTLISLIGGILGTLACVAWLTWQPLSISTEGVSVDFIASPQLLVWGLGLSALIGLVAGLVPAWQAGRAEIVNSLR
ncbi:MAG TPA: ABC transporter permease [Gemmatales bacterium]|nr:ABC transporter permease [Gemmatales bacterium]